MASDNSRWNYISVTGRQSYTLYFVNIRNDVLIERFQHSHAHPTRAPKQSRCARKTPTHSCPAGEEEKTIERRKTQSQLGP